MSDVKCPYCNKELEVCHDDGFGYDEDEAYEMECSECGKSFVFFTRISVNHIPYQADCLNGAEHKFRLQATQPRAFSQMICDDCYKTRDLTQEERLKLGIETRKEYFNRIKE